MSDKLLHSKITILSELMLLNTNRVVIVKIILKMEKSTFSDVLNLSSKKM